MKLLTMIVLFDGAVNMCNALSLNSARSTNPLKLKALRSCEQGHDENDTIIEQQNVGTEDNFDTYQNIDDDKNNSMDIKMALAKHTLLSVAASIMCIPPEVFTTPPPIDPHPPSTPEEKAVRERVTNIFSRGWSATDGFKTPKDEVDALNRLMGSDETGHLPTTYKPSLPSTYGEITALGARQLFDYLGLTPHDERDLVNKEVYTFVDLGCGSGKLLVQSYMELPSVNRIIGIELANARYQAAINAWDKVKLEASQIRQARNALDASLDIYEGDLYELDISTATHVYVASLCFTNKMMDRLAKKLVGEGDRLQCVATLKEFPEEYQKNLGGIPIKKFVEMSWTKARGNGCTVYFYNVNNTQSYQK